MLKSLIMITVLFFTGSFDDARAGNKLGQECSTLLESSEAMHVVSPGTELMLARGGSTIARSHNGRIRLAKEISNFDWWAELNPRPAFSPDGNSLVILATLGAKFGLFLVDLRTNKRTFLEPPGGHIGQNPYLRYSDDGRFALAVYLDGNFTIVDVSTHKFASAQLKRPRVFDTTYGPQMNFMPGTRKILAQEEKGRRYMIDAAAFLKAKQPAETIVTLNGRNTPRPGLMRSYPYDIETIKGRNWVELGRQAVGGNKFLEFLSKDGATIRRIDPKDIVWDYPSTKRAFQPGTDVLFLSQTLRGQLVVDTIDVDTKQVKRLYQADTLGDSDELKDTHFTQNGRFFALHFITSNKETNRSEAHVVILDSASGAEVFKISVPSEYLVDQTNQHGVYSIIQTNGNSFVFNTIHPLRTISYNTDSGEIQQFDFETYSSLLPSETDLQRRFQHFSLSPDVDGLMFIGAPQEMSLPYQFGLFYRGKKVDFEFPRQTKSAYFEKNRLIVTYLVEGAGPRRLAMKVYEFGP